MLLVCHFRSPVFSQFLDNQERGFMAESCYSSHCSLTCSPDFFDCSYLDRFWHESSLFCCVMDSSIHFANYIPAMTSEAPLTFARSRISVSTREQTLREWKTKLNEAKSLYWEGRYKRCAVLCESLLKDNIERPRRLAFSKVTALQLHP